MPDRDEKKPSIPKLEPLAFHDSKDHLGNDTWGTALTPANSARAASIAAAPESEPGSALLAPPSSGVQSSSNENKEQRESVKTLIEPILTEYCRVSHGIRLWHSGSRNRAVARGAKVTSVENVLFSGIPLLYFHHEKDAFEKRFLQLDPGFNFLYLLQQKHKPRTVDSYVNASGNAPTFDMDRERQINDSTTIKIRLDTVGQILFGEKAYKLAKDNFMVRDPRVTLKDLTILVKREEKKALKKQAAQLADEEGMAKPERILKIEECTVLLTAPQQHLRRCLTLAIAKNPGQSRKHVAAASIITSSVRNRLLRKRVAMRLKVIDHMQIMEKPRLAFFPPPNTLDKNCQIAWLADFRAPNGSLTRQNQVNLQYLFRISQLIDTQTMNSIPGREAVQATLRDQEIAACTASVNQMGMEIDDLRYVRGLVKRSSNALEIVCSKALLAKPILEQPSALGVRARTRTRSRGEESPNNQEEMTEEVLSRNLTVERQTSGVALSGTESPSPPSGSLEISSVVPRATSLGQDDTSELREVSSLSQSIDFPVAKHPELLKQLEQADLYFIQKNLRKLKHIESEDASKWTLKYLREEDETAYNVKSRTAAQEELQAPGAGTSPGTTTGGDGAEAGPGAGVARPTADVVPGEDHGGQDLPPTERSHHSGGSSARQSKAEFAGPRLYLPDRLRERETLSEQYFNVPMAYKTARSLQVAALFCAELDQRLERLVNGDMSYGTEEDVGFFGAVGGGGAVASARNNMDSGRGQEGEAAPGGSAAGVETGEDGKGDVERESSSVRSKAFAQSYLGQALSSCTSRSGGN
ncbi:unnamed protein product [Amoebophrya sp. A120]|nr:unnamed protein product [Amoebophrya sp. A120]|eukprot:GSA120T00014781001.1